MKVAIVVFPGSNCDRDISWAIKNICGKKPDYIWHKEKNFTNYKKFTKIDNGIKNLINWFIDYC